MDTWTENATLWMAGPNVTITENHLDFINASAYYNNTSIEFLTSNSSSIQMALTKLDDSVNCGANGFKNMSFRAKIVTPDSKPVNITLYLYSSDTDYFANDLTSYFSNETTGAWNNLTLPVGSGSWISIGSPSWNNITSLKLDFSWNNESNIDLRIDGLFFRGIYETPLVVYGSYYLLSSAGGALAHFFFQWLVLTALMFMLIKGLKGNVVWKPLLICVGVASIIFVIQSVILAVAYSTLPNLYYPIEALAGVPGEYDVAYQAIVNLVSTVTLIAGVLQIIILAWNVGLGTFITREVSSVPPQTLDESMPIVAQPLSWSKCLLVSVTSVVVTLVVLYLIGV